MRILHSGPSLCETATSLEGATTAVHLHAFFACPAELNLRNRQLQVAARQLSVSTTSTNQRDLRPALFVIAQHLLSQPSSALPKRSCNQSILLQIQFTLSIQPVESAAICTAEPKRPSLCRSEAAQRKWSRIHFEGMCRPTSCSVLCQGSSCSPQSSGPILSCNSPG
jgi:hypothetical protein